MDKIYAALQAYLQQHNIATTRDHTSSGDHNLRLNPSTTLAVLVELYDEETGDSTAFTLGDLLDHITDD